MLILAAFVAGAAGGILAQSGRSFTLAADGVASGSLSGRVTDLHSAPLAGLTVTVRNQSTGAEARTITAKNGGYRFGALAPGEYSLEAESPQMRRGELDGIEVVAGHESRVHAAMELEQVVAAGPAAAAAREQVRAQAVETAKAALPARAEANASAANCPIHCLRAEENIPQGLKTASSKAVSGTTEVVPFQMPVDTSSSKAAINAAPAGEHAVAARAAPAMPQAALAVAPAAASHAASTPPAIAELHPPAPVPAGSLHAAAMPDAVHAASVAAGTAMAQAVLGVLAASSQFERARNAAVEPGLAAAAVSTTISGDQLQTLPVSGRRWQDLFLDTPAANSGTSGSQLTFGGGDQGPADTAVDGASTRLAFGVAAGSPELSAQDPSGQGQPSTGGAQGLSGGRGFFISSAAIREVRVVAGNVEAEGAHAAGGRAGVKTESGGNELHGQGFFFDRQNTWGARNPFTQWVQNTGTAAAPSFSAVPFTPPDHETSWGAGAGSRILRDRLFWFAALDGYRRNDPGVASVREFSEVFAPVEPTTPDVVLLSAQLNETENQAYGDYMGVPRAGIAGAGLEQLAGLLGPAPRTAAQWVGFARLDWQAAERHRFSLEGTGADWSAPGGGLTRVSETYGNHSFGSSQARQQWLLARWEAFITPNLLAVTQASAGREVLSALPDAPSNLEQGFLGSGWNSYGQLPQIVVDSRYGFTIGNPSRFGQGSYPDERMIRAQEMVDWVHGKLLVKAGSELDHNTDATTLLRNQTGSYTYSTVQNFIADALVFQKFGVDASNYQNQHNCNPANNGRGALPCYSYFSQEIGPNFWQIGTNDWATYTTAQWQLTKFAVLSAGVRWEREQLPQPIKLVDNPALPLTERLPDLGNQWGPRISLALGNRGRLPVLRLGYGMYYGRSENATLETVLTQTGSPNGDLYFFIRPTDGYTSATNTSSAPPFPSVLSGTPGSVVVPGAVEYAPNFRNSEVHQALVAVEQRLPGRVMLTATAMVSLGRRLPISIDTNFNPAVNPGTITYNVSDKTGKGPLTGQITVPFYGLWPSTECGSALRNVAGQCGRLNNSYQQITEIESRANSTYEAAMVRFTRYGERGLSLHAHYTYAHAMDWNPNESTTVAGSDVLDPAHFNEEYGTSNLDVRHSTAAMLIYEAPWKLRGVAGRLANGWMVSGIGQFHSGLPYSMRTTGAIPKELDTYGDPTIVGLGPGMNGSGGDNRVYGVGRNTFRYPQTWKADVRLGKRFYLSEHREFELLAESFNLFNHQNVTEIETTGYEIESGSSGTLPTLNYLTVGTTGADATLPAFGQPFNINGTNFYRERQIELGARLRF